MIDLMGGFRAHPTHPEHCEAQTEGVAHPLGGTTQLSLCQVGCISHLPVMLTELEMSRLIVQAFLPCIFCTGTSHEVPLLGNPAIIYTQGLGMLVLCGNV